MKSWFLLLDSRSRLYYRCMSEVRDKTYARIALASLSYSEQIAIEKIMEVVIGLKP